ncbi:MAG: hypothetical protein V3V92_02575 [Candidatus Hydrothermarchaeales archaeon]
MSYSLSFTESFFSGPEDYPEPSDRPTNVLQAIESLSGEEKLNIAQEVFNYQGRLSEFFAFGEGFNHSVLNKVRETNTCTDISSPVEVWIDDKGWFTLTIYNEG